jgi:hypothetical protein
MLVGFAVLINSVLPGYIEGPLWHAIFQSFIIIYLVVVQ